MQYLDESWITSKRFLPVFKQDEKDTDQPIEKWEDAYWDDESEISQKLIEFNETWFQEGDEGMYLVASPRIWRRWKEIINKLPLDNLLYFGLFPNKLLEYIKDHPTRVKQLRKILQSLVPNADCIKAQLKYIYSIPMAMAAIANYSYDHELLLRIGRKVSRQHKKPMDRGSLSGTLEGYHAFERGSEDFFTYLNMSLLQRYNFLNKLILNAPCTPPLILFRGHFTDDRLKLKTRKSGYRFINDSILSTSFNIDRTVDFHYDDCCLDIYHLARGVPRLFTNTVEFEFLLPAGLEMEYVRTEVINGLTCFRIKVLGLASFS